MKNQKGITLVALVITIIILIILAGVTITLALQQNGLFQRAQDSQKYMTNAQNYDNERLQEVETQINDILNGVQ